MNNRVKTLAFVSGAAMVLPGCASIVSRSDWPVAIKSTPDQAEFTISNKSGGKVHSGTTPVTVTLPAKAGYFSGETYKVSYSKAGYETKTASLDTGINGWFWGNFVFGGLIGFLIVDPLTGAMWRLPEEVHVSMPPSNQ